MTSDEADIFIAAVVEVAIRYEKVHPGDAWIGAWAMYNSGDFDEGLGSVVYAAKRLAGQYAPIN